MKKYIYLIVVVILLVSCSNTSSLGGSIECKSELSYATKSKVDFRRNFKMKVPKHWKTQLYYDAQTSEIFIADTTKQLTNTFILSSSLVNSKLTIDSVFVKKHSQKMEQQQMYFVKGKSLRYKNKPAYWSIFQGVKSNRKIHQFSFFIEISNNSYFIANTDVYGTKNVEKRICESVSIIEEITFFGDE